VILNNQHILAKCLIHKQIIFIIRSQGRKKKWNQFKPV